ncbi:fHA domain protein [Prevotella sp. CAG:1185]|nr:fHA domain protein [Prevotella sp. CAG:1185]
MKRVRCPKCDEFITFDETKYKEGQSLIFECPQCGKQFGIRIGATKLRNTQKKEIINENEYDDKYGAIIVIENVFHYKQVIPLKLGDNIIGRYMKGSKTNTPIETNDPSIDITHCIINVSIDKKGHLKYILRDGPSYTGTFVDNEILGNKERRIIYDGTLFTIGATSIILKAPNGKDDNKKDINE